MSMELKLAQGKLGLLNNPRPQGDPGFFGFLGDVVKKGISFVSDPVGTVTGFIGDVFGEEPPPIPIAIATARPILTTANLFQQQQAGTPPEPSFGDRLRVAGQALVPGGVEPFAVNGNGNGCASGFHLNKSSYFLRNGTFIQKGSRCVKNRRRNDFNGRAISRSMKRLTGAKKASKMIGRVTIRCGKCVGKCNCR